MTGCGDADIWHEAAIAKDYCFPRTSFSPSLVTEAPSPLVSVIFIPKHGLQAVAEGYLQLSTGIITGDSQRSLEN